MLKTQLVNIPTATDVIRLRPRTLSRSVCATYPNQPQLDRTNQQVLDLIWSSYPVFQVLAGAQTCTWHTCTRL